MNVRYKEWNVLVWFLAKSKRRRNLKPWSFSLSLAYLSWSQCVVWFTAIEFWIRFVICSNFYYRQNNVSTPVMSSNTKNLISKSKHSRMTSFRYFTFNLGISISYSRLNFKVAFRSFNRFFYYLHRFVISTEVIISPWRPRHSTKRMNASSYDGSELQ